VVASILQTGCLPECSNAFHLFIRLRQIGYARTVLGDAGPKSGRTARSMAAIQSQEAQAITGVRMSGGGDAWSESEMAAELADRRILVTGGSGFLGAALCRRLLGEGPVVHATSRQVQPEPPVFWQPNLEDAGAVRELFEEVRPDVVYHFAGQVTADPDRSLVLPLFNSLLGSTVNVMLAASEMNCPRVVLAGSLTEPAGPGEVPASPYAAAKFACSGYAKMFHAIYGLSVVITRPFMTYGPGQHPSKVVPYATATLLSGASPKLSSGRAESDWIYIDDVVDGHVRAGLVDDIGGREVDLGTGTLVSLRAVIENVAAQIGGPGRPQFGGQADRPMERPREARVAEARELLKGWRPVVDLDEGLRRTIEALRDT
jgi:UDP-glucose 4-epimerase